MDKHVPDTYIYVLFFVVVVMVGLICSGLLGRIQKAELRIAELDFCMRTEEVAPKVEIQEVSATKISARLSAYCPCEKCCGEFADGITASGVSVQEIFENKAKYGFCVAAPKHVPFYTKVLIQGVGVGTVLDRGGAIKGNKLDLLFPTHQEALNFGVREALVTFYEGEK